jgi:hypothetical protein
MERFADQPTVDRCLSSLTNINMQSFDLTQTGIFDPQVLPRCQ